MGRTVSKSYLAMFSKLQLIILAALATGFSSVAAVASPAAVRGTVFLTRDEALELAFPEIQVERKTQFLSKEEKARVKKLSGLDFDRGCIYPYEARKDGKLIGTAYFDNHRVRTLRETVMIVVSPEQKVERIEVLAFGEPTDYIPREVWYAQFHGRPLDKDLNLKRKIRGVAGATLTARATTEAARRVLAVHRVLGERQVVGTPVARATR